MKKHKLTHITHYSLPKLSDKIHDGTNYVRYVNFNCEQLRHHLQHTSQFEYFGKGHSYARVKNQPYAEQLHHRYISTLEEGYQ